MMWPSSSDFRTGDTLRQRSFVQHVLHLDGPLLALLVLLSAGGVVVLYSAFGQDFQQVEKHILRLLAAFAAMAILAQIPPATLRRWTPWLFGLGILILVAVLLAGVVSGGAKRWLDLGLVRFQPSELMKLALPMALSAFLGAGTLPPPWTRVLAGLAMILIPTALVAVQPDLGTALLIASSGFFVLFLGGLGWRFIGAAVLMALGTAPLLWYFGMHDYQRERVLTFLNPERDPLGSGYHIIQSKIAIGSGGLYGKGWTNGTQAHLDFLPERHTDFVFAVLSEEFGLMGVTVLLTLYLAVIARGLYIASRAQDSFSRLLAGSISLTFFVYVFVNIGMVSGLLPVVGLPLPLISYGGSSMVTLLAAFGMLMSIHTHRRLWSS